MFRFQSGPRHAAGSPLKPFRPFAAAVHAALCTTLCGTLMTLVAPFAAHAQVQAQMQVQAQVPGQTQAQASQAQASPARQSSDLRPDPLSPQASVPPLVHESAFTRYRRLSDAPVGSWRDANDTVNRIGGWRVYAREAAQPASAAATPGAPVPAGSASAPGSKPAPPAQALPMPTPAGKDPHAGHKMN